MSQCMQPPGAGLETRRRPDHVSRLMGVGTKSEVPPEPFKLWSGEFAPQQMPGTHHSWVDCCGDDVRWITITLLDGNGD